MGGLSFMGRQLAAFSRVVRVLFDPVLEMRPRSAIAGGEMRDALWDDRRGHTILTISFNRMELDLSVN